ncbi:MAG: hypothetical protein NVS3B26_21040 [Mycobacteriales bacterium]
MMMTAGGGFFPWPVLFMIPIMIAMVVFLARRAGHSPGGTPGCGSAARLAPPVDAVSPPAAQDPMVVLRERLARGEIGLPEFDARLTGLLRSDPAESMPWWGNPAPVGPS